MFTPSARTAPSATPSFRQRAVVVAADAGSWLVAVALTASLVGLLRPGTGGVIAVGALAAAAAQVAAGAGTGLYRRRWTRGSLDEARVVVVTAALVATLSALVPLLAPSRLGPATAWPPALPLVAFPVALIAMGATRSVLRSRAERAMRPGRDATPTLVFGAGTTGEHLVRQMRTDPACPHRPVGLLDDDPGRRGVRLAGLKVLGDRDDLPDVTRRTGAGTLVLAMPRADAAVVREVTERAEAVGLRVLTVPSIGEVLAGSSGPADLRDVSLEDLVGRRPVDTDLGAGGSIGTELCRQLARFAPAELTMLDHDETALQSVQVALSGHGLLDTRDVVLADIRDAAALAAVFRSRRPEVVFHAAALKHLPMLEQYPSEAWQTNVAGTLNVLEAARAVDVETFVTISTDKAAAPTSVLGRSKRLAEQLTAGAAASTGRRYLSVRFGNVLGSRGSMVPLFRELIASGRPLTVTHPDATRYFMTIPEACQLVVQAGAIGAPGEVLILDMGEPVRVLDVARRMIARSGRDVEVVFTGLRPGEKLHEQLTGEGEHDERPVHPLISHATVPPLDAGDLDVTAVLRDPPAGPVRASA